MKKNKSGLSLVIAIGLTLVMSVLALYILEYIVPFSKNTKNIEKSVEAYYQADSAIEDALFSNSNDNLDDTKRLDYGTEIESEGSVLPPIGEGNSEFDNDFNSIRIGQAIKLEIGSNNVDPDSLNIFFRIPDLDGDGTFDEKLALLPSKIITWQISGTNNILNPEDSQITNIQINGSLKNGDLIFGSAGINRKGRDLNDNILDFKSFYISNCGIGNTCKMKLSVVNQLKLINGENIPYLEWKITTGNGKKIPLRYKIIETTGKSSEYRKSLKVKVPGKKLNDAYDFALFQ